MTALNLLSLLLPFAMMIGLGILLPLLAVVMLRRFGVGLAVVLSTAVVDLLLPNLPVMRVGITVYLPDLVLSGVALVALLRAFSGASGRLRSTSLLVFVLIVGLNLVQGLMQFKGTAGAAARPTFYALASAAYVWSFAMDRQHLATLFKALAWGALAMAAVVLLRWAAVLLDVRELLPADGSFQPQGHSVWRVVASAESLLMAEVALSFGFFAAIAPRLVGMRLAALVLLLVTVALQHRSVWLAATAGMLISLWHIDRSEKRVSRWMLPMLALSAALVALMLANPERPSSLALPRGDVASDISASARDAIALRGTAADRLSSWRQLVAQWAGSGPRGLALGAPFGTSMERYTSDDIGARKIAYQPHNFYVEVLVSHGVLGLAAFLAMFGVALRAAWRLRGDEERGLAGHWLVVLLVCQLVYYLTYGIDFMQTLVLGAALSVAREIRPNSQSARVARLTRVAQATQAAQAAKPGRR